MNHSTDQQLLREFAERRSDTAFAELVRRHVDLVYSAALRMVRDADLAKDVTQGVFVALSNNAPKLVDNAALEGWLHGTTRNLAANAARTEVRRRNREQEAAIMNEILSTGADANWEHIAPHLDEALGELTAPERDVLLLRYFKNLNFHAVGAQLGVSDDTAQKRVSRAVERLREFFAKRGVTVGAGGLVVVISANAVQAAPVGLAVTISAAALAGTAATASTLIAATTKTIAMTTLQKTLVTATVVVLAGAGIYEARQAARLRDQVQTLQQQQAPLAAQIQELQNGLADATNRLVGLLAENSRLKSNPHEAELLKLRGETTRLRMALQAASETAKANNPTAMAQSWLNRVSALKAKLGESPEAGIPELKFVTEQDWLDATKGKLETEDDYRKALSRIRSAGENKFVSELQPALRKYMEEHDGKFPAQLADLQLYFKSPVDDAILHRWAILPAKEIKSLGMGGDWIITQREAVDKENDQRWGIGPSGYGTTGFGSFQQKADPLETLSPALRAYLSSNGQMPTEPSQLLPYATTTEQKARLDEIIQQFKVMSDSEKSEMKSAVEKFMAGQSSTTK